MQKTTAAALTLATHIMQGDTVQQHVDAVKMVSLAVMCLYYNACCILSCGPHANNAIVAYRVTVKKCNYP